MNRIIEKQNEPKFIQYLSAQRIAYSQSKFYKVFDLISILIAIILPIIGIFQNDIVNYLAVFGVLWVIIYLFSETYRKRKTEQGAKIQEQFDVELFSIAWNKILCKSKINSDKIIDLAKEYEKKDLKNWYSLEIKTELPKQIAILLCQRINFSWELNLRKLYVRLLVVTVILYYGLFIGYSIFQNVGVYDFLLLIAPSISFLIYAVQNSLSLKRHIESKNETLKQIDKYLERYSKRKKVPKESILRQIQDVIFTERTVPEKIPDWFYYFHKETNENRTDQIIKSLIAKF